MLSPVKCPGFYHIWPLITHKEQLLRFALPFETGDAIFTHKHISSVHHLCLATAKTSSKLHFPVPSIRGGLGLIWRAFTRCTKEQNKPTWALLLLEYQPEPHKALSIYRPVKVTRTYRCLALQENWWSKLI